MQLVIRSTEDIALIDGVWCRCWESFLGNGSIVYVWVSRIRTDDLVTQANIDSEFGKMPSLEEKPPPVTGKSRPTAVLDLGQIERIS